MGVFFLRVIDDLVGGAVFDHRALLQDHDVVADLRHYSQIVRDIKGGNARVADRFLDCGQHVDLGGHVERGCGFVKHHQIGLGTQCKSRHAAL